MHPNFVSVAFYLMMVAIVAGTVFTMGLIQNRIDQKGGVSEKKQENNNHTLLSWERGILLKWRNAASILLVLTLVIIFFALMRDIKSGTVIFDTLLWVSSISAAILYIAEKLIQKKIRSNGISSSTMIAEASRVSNPSLPKVAEKLVSDNDQLRKWQMPLIVTRYFFILCTVTIWYWFI